MEPEALIAIYCFIGMLALIMVGLPIFISMFLAAFVGFWIIGGMNFALTQFANGPYNITSDYTFAVVPMFVLMGILAGDSGIAEATYIAVGKWVSRLRGGLLMATVGAAALFGACSGVNIASAAVFTKISLPELEKYGYNKSLSMGCIAAAGVLSSLIPPSIPIIIFCVLANISIGRSLIGGIIPGVLTAVILALTIYVMGIIRPKQIPQVDIKVTWRERFSSLTSLWPMIFLFVLVIGGIYAGIFPPTVGGAIGAAGVLLYAVFRRLGKKKIASSLWETAIINAQLFPLIIGGFMFGRFITLSGLPEIFVNLITAAQLHPMIIMGLVVILYLFLGCVMELFSMLIITIPIIFPVMTSLGFDPIALCIVLVFLCDLGAVTPPIGMACFVVAAVAKVDPTEVFKGILPFFFVELVILWVVILFPSIVTWLPNLFF